MLDLCAAPGGKTPPLVRGAGQSGMVVAGERHAHRLRAMREQFKRLSLYKVCGWSNWMRRRRCRLRRASIGSWWMRRVPGLGRWRGIPRFAGGCGREQLLEFHELQCALLTNAIWGCSRPEGRLVYSTCSMEPEENEERG